MLHSGFVTESQLRWLLAVVQVPSEPSRHRVAVWRELRRSGAALVAQGTWAMPATDAYREALERAMTLAAEGGGRVAVFDAEPRDDIASRLLVDTFAAARVDEWREFNADCGKFTDEIDHEIAKSKFTFAELEEEEQSLDRLRRWHRDLKKRDILSLPDAQVAAGRLKDAEKALEGYAERVYEANRLTDTR